MNSSPDVVVVGGGVVGASVAYYLSLEGPKSNYSTERPSAAVAPSMALEWP